MTVWLDLTPVPFRLGYVDAGGVRTRALTAGEGPPALFLHGTSGHLEAFSRNIAPHVEAGFACHAIDMLGHGYTAASGEPAEIPAYVEHVLAYLDAAGIDRVHLAGESLGGWVSAWLASEHPERVHSVQLIAAGGTKANPQIMERIKASTTEAVTTDDVELTRQRLNLLMANPERDVTEELVQIRYRIYHRPEFQKNLPHLLALQEMERRQRNLLRPDRLARLTMPTLVVWGRQNPFGEVPEAQAMHEAVPGSRLELFDDCGHWPQYEQADRYNALAIAFLREAGG